MREMDEALEKLEPSCSTYLISVGSGLQSIIRQYRS